MTDEHEAGEWMTIEGNVSMQIKEGAITASEGREKAEVMARVDDIAFGDAEGKVTLQCGSPPDHIGTGLRITFDSDQFKQLLEDANELWGEEDG